MSHSHTFSFHTSDPAMAASIAALLAGGAKPEKPHAVAASPAPAPVATPAPVAAAPVATPAPAPTLAAASADDEEDAGAKANGWTFDHVRAAAQAFTAKHGNQGPTMLAQIVGKHLPGEPKPSLAKLRPKHWPHVHADLTA